MLLAAERCTRRASSRAAPFHRPGRRPSCHGIGFRSESPPEAIHPRRQSEPSNRFQPPNRLTNCRKWSAPGLQKLRRDRRTGTSVSLKPDQTRSQRRGAHQTTGEKHPSNASFIQSDIRWHCIKPQSQRI